jgi:hypothetical protein
MKSSIIQKELNSRRIYKSTSMKFLFASSLDYTAFCVDYRLKKEYPFNLEAPDYDLDSQAYLKPPTETWGKIEPHERKEIEKIEILKDHEVKGAFILLNLFSEVECEHYIKETESIGYEPLLGYHRRRKIKKWSQVHLQIRCDL